MRDRYLSNKPPLKKREIDINVKGETR